MPPAVTADPILKRFRAALAEIYGDRIERVVLFGSRARGDASDDSDYDVAVFLNDLKEGDLTSRWRELDRLADLRSEILADTEAFIDAKPYPAGAYRMPDSSFFSPMSAATYSSACSGPRWTNSPQPASRSTACSRSISTATR
jgi:predicted nucleotidyltransferase